MEKKLYRVKVVLYVMAENTSDACVAATQAHFDIFECVARKAEDIVPEWKDAIPYNSEDDRTCSEILNNSNQSICPETSIVKYEPYFGVALHDLNTANQSFLQG